jgi:hypothetical protein
VSGLPEPIRLMMLEMQVDQLQRSRRAVLADPVKHKATLHWPDNEDPRWLYYEVKGKRGPVVRYGYTTNRNLAGYFLAFRETFDVKRGTGKRDQFVASKRRKTVADRALARFKAHKARIKVPPPKPLEERRTTYWISERFPMAQPNCTGSRGLGKIVCDGGPNTALDLARIKWPEAGDIVAVHIGRKP